MSDFETKEPFTWNQTDELKNKVKELEKDLAYFKAIYNTLIDGAARDTNKINDLELKLSHQIQIMDAMTRTSQNNFELSEKLNVAVKALDLWSETGDIDTIREAADNALKEITSKQGEKE